MSKVTITIDSTDVAELREVFSLALIQSEARVADLGTTDGSTDARWVIDCHNAVCALMARIDAMLPDSTGFFD